MNAIRVFTISVEYDGDEPLDVLAITDLADEFEECIGKAGLYLDNIEEEDVS